MITKLFWTQFRDPDALARFVMLLAVALLLWTWVGFAEAHWDPSLRLHSRKKGPRQSYVTIGIRVLAAGPWHTVLLRESSVRCLLQPLCRTLRRLDSVAVGGK